MAKLETPMGLAFCVCDSVIEDRTTRKKSLIGLFDRVSSRHFPCVHPELTVYLSLTSGHGTYPCACECRHTDGETIAFRVNGSVTMKDPTQVADLVFRLRGVRFEKPGTYWLQFMVDGDPLLMRRFLVHEAETRKEEGA
jgi:hypothetical protein